MQYKLALSNFLFIAFVAIFLFSEEKPFPTIPNTFTAKFQWNMNLVNTSFYVEEFFSQDLNLGVVIVENMLGPGKRSKFISDPEKQQLIMILGEH